MREGALLLRLQDTGSSVLTADELTAVVLRTGPRHLCSVLFLYIPTIKAWT